MSRWGEIARCQCACCGGLSIRHFATNSRFIGTGPTIAKGTRRPQQTWSVERERHYVHIRDGLVVRGKAESLAKKNASRIVNRDRAQHGESVEACAASIDGMTANRRGGLRSHQGARGRTLV
jgi:hypothetical protein